MRIMLDTGEQVEFDTVPVALTPPERMRRGLKGFAIGLFLALVSLFLPVIHFVLVPTFLVVAVYLGLARYRQRYEVDVTKLNCPKCHAPMNEKKVFTKENRLRLFCNNCRSQLWMELPDFR